MAVPEQTPYVEYNGNGVSKVFPLTFDCNNSDHLIVKVNDEVPEVGNWSLVDAKVVFTVPPDKDSKIVLQRNTPSKRATTYKSYDNSFRPAPVDSDFDTIWHKLQELGVLNWLTENNISDLNGYVNSLNNETRQQFFDALKEAGLTMFELDKYIDSLFNKMANIAVERGWLAEFVVDGNKTQKQINEGLQSIPELLTILEPRNGQRFFVKGLQGGWFEYNEGKSTINDGGMVLNGWVRISLETSIKPEWFGSPRNGVDDDADGIRKALAYLKSQGGGCLFFTKSPEKYQALTSDANNSAFTVDSSDIALEFESDTTEIIARTTMGSICYLNAFIYNFSMNKGRLNANNLCQFSLNTNPLYYTPLITINASSFRNAIHTCLSLRTYVGSLNKVNTYGGKTGISIKASVSGGTIITSLTLTSCYPMHFSEFGYDLSIACYCSFISCAADNSPTGIAYKLTGRGFAMIGCGTENTLQPIQLVSCRGLSISGFYCQRVGSTDPLNPQPYLIELVTGQNITISGLLIENNSTRYYDKKLAITSADYGSECVTVTDRSITRSQVSFVTNFEFNTRPIKILLDDATQKNKIVSIANMAEFREFIRTYLTEYAVNHTLTVQLANGTYAFGEIQGEISALVGGGEVVIQGNSSDRSLVVLETDYNRLQIKNCKAKVRLKNLTISGSVGNNSYERLIIDNSPFVVLDNVLINKNGMNVGVGVRAINNSIVYITNGTIANSSLFSIGIFIKDLTSKFVMDPAAAAPSTLNWSTGMIVENISPTTHLGWIFSGGAWKNFGAIA